MFSDFEQEMQSEYNAQFDYYSEAYSNEVESIESLKQEAHSNWVEEVKEDIDAIEARGGPEYLFSRKCYF